DRFPYWWVSSPARLRRSRAGDEARCSAVWSPAASPLAVSGPPLRGSSVVEQKLLRIQQPPQQILRPRRPARPLGDQGRGGGGLGLGGRAAEGDAVERLDQGLVGQLRVPEHPGEAAVGLGDLAVDGVAVHQVKRLAERRVAGALAFAGDGAERAAEGVE